MNSILKNNEKSKRYLPHELKTKENAVKTYRNGNSIDYVCRKYHISRTSLYRWNKKYDGTKESLMDTSHKPKTKHPNAHTDVEIKHIKDLIRRNPNITLCELWFKLRLKYSYSRHIGSLYRVLRRLNIIKDLNVKGTSKYIPKKYETPSMIGIKWQIDVKFVPKVCKIPELPNDKNFYQYTCIDEASRERFLYWYEEHTPQNTVDFIKRCIIYYGYQPIEIQTDNGMEFTWNTDKFKVIHPMDNLCLKLGIMHHKIRPRTPRHNGKVERSHRNDQNRFYSYLKFYSYDDLKIQMKSYLKRSNNIPMQVLGWISPLEKRKQIIEAKASTAG